MWESDRSIDMLRSGRRHLLALPKRFGGFLRLSLRRRPRATSVHLSLLQSLEILVGTRWFQESPGWCSPGRFVGVDIVFEKLSRLGR